MKFRKASKIDIEDIMAIIKHGQNFLKEQGVEQWQNNYPNYDSIHKDIEKGYGYIVEMDKELVATVALSFDGEITYKKIYEGEWLSDYDYCVIHRMAIHKEKRGSGIASFMMDNINKLCQEKGIRSIKVDTHRDNIPMQKYLEKNGFKHCGIIYVTDGSERLAFEKIL